LKAWDLRSVFISVEFRVKLEGDSVSFSGIMIGRARVGGNSSDIDVDSEGVVV